MKMDLKGLCTRLDRAKEGESVSTKYVNKYLLNQVLRPLMEEKKVFLRDIDFEEFDAADIHVLTDYYESLGMQGRVNANLKL